MNWIDIVSIVFVCVTVNHLGLVSAIEHTIKTRLWVVNCPKCLTFWATVVYCCDKIATHRTGDVAHAAIMVLAISFLASYVGIWLELLEGYVDTLYMKAYEKITTANNDDATAADADNGNSAGSVSEL